MGRLLTGHGKTLSLAESCTGGLITERLTDMPGSSRFLNCAVVAYSNASKVELLGVDEEVLNKYGAVSEEAALAMAQGMLKLSGSDLALSVTGIAGPEGGTEEKPVGLVYVALCAKGAGVEHYTRKLSLGNRVNRSEVRWRTANQALNMVRLYLLEPAALKV